MLISPRRNKTVLTHIGIWTHHTTDHARHRRFFGKEARAHDVLVPDLRARARACGDHRSRLRVLCVDVPNHHGSSLGLKPSMAVPKHSLSRRSLLGLQCEPARAVVCIADHCLAYREIACESCADVCEARAIQFHRTGRVRRPLIDTAACTGCEACVEVCPAGALNIQKPNELNT